MTELPVFACGTSGLDVVLGFSGTRRVSLGPARRSRVVKSDR